MQFIHSQGKEAKKCRFFPSLLLQAIYHLHYVYSSVECSTLSSAPQEMWTNDESGTHAIKEGIKAQRGN